MRIKSFSYKDETWELDQLHLDAVNLIVGKNGTGKTRTLRQLELLINILNESAKITWGSKWDIVWEMSDGRPMEYSLHTSKEGLITREILKKDGIRLLSRVDDLRGVLGKIVNYGEKGVYEDIYPPKGKMAILSNRNIRDYPYIEWIVDWAQQAHQLNFGTVGPTVSITGEKKEQLAILQELPLLFQDLTKEEQQHLVAAYQELGYAITDIQFEKQGGIAVLLVKEAHIEQPIPHWQLSDGMYRALAVLLYVSNAMHQDQPTALLIDDLCQGLDYERATKLGKYLYGRALEHNIQLIATSNDSFLMDVVSIQYWNVLRRHGKQVRGINAEKYPEIFEDFEFTGLSNFDFFASSYLTSVGL